MLDDIWKHELASTVLPPRCLGSSKLLVTSRRHDVVAGGCLKVEVGLLNEEESLHLLLRYAGCKSVTQDRCKFQVQQLAKACRGHILTIAM